MANNPDALTVALAGSTVTITGQAPFVTVSRPITGTTFTASGTGVIGANVNASASGTSSTAGAGSLSMQYTVAPTAGGASAVSQFNGSR